MVSGIPSSRRNMCRSLSSSATRTGSVRSSSSARADSVNARPRLCSPASRAAAADSSSTRTWSAPIALGGVRHLVPQLEDAGEQHQPLGVRDRAGRLHGRLPGADQRPGRVVGRVPVVRLLHVRPPVADQRGVGVDRERELGVHLAVLAGQQVLVHRLPDQRVPERVPVGGGHQDVAGDGGPDRGGQLVLGPAGDPGEQRGGWWRRCRRWRCGAPPGCPPAAAAPPAAAGRPGSRGSGRSRRGRRAAPR